jgi:hypothetical protein
LRLAAFDRHIDAAFAAWVTHHLPAPLRPVATRLPSTLGLTRSHRWTSWRRVFHSPLIRAAPGLVAEAFPLPVRTLTNLGLAHVLSVLLAFLDDRANDGQAVLTRDLQLVRRAMEGEVTARLAAAVGESPHFWRAVRRDGIGFLRAHVHEAAVWAGAPAPPAAYVRHAAAKFPMIRWSVLATALLGGARRADGERLATCADHCVIALQYVDDVFDWRDDFHAGRWTMFIHRHLTARERRRRTITEALLRQRVARRAVGDAFRTAAMHHYARCARQLERWPLTAWHAWVTAQQQWLAAWSLDGDLSGDGPRKRFAAALQQVWAV